MREEILEYVKNYITGAGLQEYPDVFLLLLIDFVIEKYKSRRNYPSDFTESRIAEDLSKTKMTIMMATIDIYSKVGAEGHVTYNDNGINRTFENAYISLNLFSNVIPFCHFY